MSDYAITWQGKESCRKVCVALSAVAFGECFHYGLSADSDELLHVVALFARQYGLVDGEMYVARARKLGGTRQYAVSSVDGHRHYRQVEFLCQGERSTLELTDFAVERSCAFRKHYDGHSFG